MKLRNCQKPFNNEKSVGIRQKICTHCRVSGPQFYLYHSTEIAKAWPGFNEL